MRRVRVGIGIALILLIPVFLLPAAGEDGAPLGTCWAAGGVGAGDRTGVFLYNASGFNGSADPSPAIRFECPARLVPQPAWQPRAPQAPAPFALDYVSGEWIAPDVFRVTWRSNSPSMGRLWWGPSGGAIIGYLEDGAFSEAHRAEVRGLEPGVTYSFQAAAIDRESAFVISIPLQTAAPAAPNPGSNVGVGAALAIATGAAVAAIRLRTAHRR